MEFSWHVLNNDFRLHHSSNHDVIYDVLICNIPFHLFDLVSISYSASNPNHVQLDHNRPVQLSNEKRINREFNELAIVHVQYYHINIKISYLVRYNLKVGIECLMDSLVCLNKYHGEFVNKTGDGYILPVVDLDRLRKTVPIDCGWFYSFREWRKNTANIHKLAR